MGKVRVPGAGKRDHPPVQRRADESKYILAAVSGFRVLGRTDPQQGPARRPARLVPPRRDVLPKKMDVYPVWFRIYGNWMAHVRTGLSWPGVAECQGRGGQGGALDFAQQIVHPDSGSELRKIWAGRQGIDGQDVVLAARPLRARRRVGRLPVHGVEAPASERAALAELKSGGGQVVDDYVDVLFLTSGREVVHGDGETLGACRRIRPGEWRRDAGPIAGELLAHQSTLAGRGAAQGEDAALDGAGDGLGQSGLGGAGLR